MRRSHLVVSLLFCALFIAFFLAPHTSSQSTLRSLSLSGNGQSVSVPNSTSINISGPITVEAWFKLNAITSSYQTILSREAFQQTGTGGGYRLAITDVGKVRLDLFQSHNTYTTLYGATTVTTGVWHHVAGVFDGSQMRIYLDGVLDGSLSSSSGPASGTGALYIGRFSNAANPIYFGGLIDEVRISAAALYTSTFTAGLGPGTNVRGLWKFDGQTANDFSGNGNHGTLQGGATYSTSVPPTTNNPPSVSLSHPQNNTSYAAGSNIVMDATAADSNGSVTKVDFYQGTTLLGTDTAAPYTFVWANVAAGSYSLTAKATDDGSATTTSTAVAVTVVAAGGQHSLSLSGSGQSVSVPNSTSINISGQITLEAWIKLNAITSSYQTILSREAFQQTGTGGGYRLAITDVGKVRLDLFQSHNTYTTLYGATTVTTGVWHHVAGVFDGSQMRIYLDGVLDGSLSSSSGPASGTGALYIGRFSNAANPIYFGGLIDEVRISAAALYTSNFTAGLGPGSNVRGLWKFDGQTANDFSGNGNYGTLQGGATYSTSVPPIGSGGSQRPVPIAGGPYSSQLAQGVQFSSSGSFDPDGTIASYHWNFGDGTTANSANPSHTYAAPGLYTATLTVTDNAGLLASATSLVSISSPTNARLDPLNQTGGGGENPLSRNLNWNVLLVSLPGRAGMDLGLTLSYNSLVWTKNGNFIAFDEDRGFPGPGFRLGFPVIQLPYFNAEAGKNAFMLIGSDGGRTELRQVGTSALYEAGDSSHLLLDAATMILRTTDGTQLSYVLMGSEYNCTQIKDRNGNFITINYTASGRIDTVIDTLGRNIVFNYDADGRLTSITQTWNPGPDEVTHDWATFTYTGTTIQTNFAGLTVNGPSNNLTINTLASVTLADGSHTDFSYTSWGQVWKISEFASDNHLLNYRSYNLPQTATSQTDCPRFTERRDWAQYWNGDTDGVATAVEEAVTTFAAPVSATWTMPDGTQKSGTRAQVTAPDLTSNKIYFIGSAGTASGWQRGLPALLNTYDSAGVLQRQSMTTWRQDDETKSYIINPRVEETNVYDPAGNRARTRITYQQFTFANGTSCRYPRDVFEYAANATAILRSTRIDYHSGAVYSDRRILGLVTVKSLYEGDVNAGGVLMSKVGFFYDNENGAASIQGTDAPVQHDNTNYTASFVTGRGNVSSVKRYDVTNTASTTTRAAYNTAGSVVSSKDALNHEVTIGYGDAFSDLSTQPNTRAYPTIVTDPDGFSTILKYDFDFGAMTSRQTPKPNVTTNTAGPVQTFIFDVIGRLERTTNSFNSAYTRFEYPTSQIRVDTYATIQDGEGEAHSFRITDGAGRVIAIATDHPTDHPETEGGFSGQKMVYDVMGRVIKTSNPTETSANGAPSQWTTAGDDASAGWIYTEQTYDWKGRPLVTTNQDGTTKSASYAGCGCAGGEVVTLTDEGTIDAGVAKRRQQKIYKDVLGRVVKIEILNWDGSGPAGTGGSIYSTTVSTYNVRDQIMLVRQHTGSAMSAEFLETNITYDGFGRIKTKHVPEQQADPVNSASTNHTTWNYNNDGTVQSIVDARGVIKTFTYNGRHLVTAIAYDKSNLPPIADVAATSSISLAYDAAGNRRSMSDGSGARTYHYDQLNRMDWEERTFSGLPGSGTYRLTYEYSLAGILKKITDERSGTSYTQQLDRIGRVISVTGVGFGGAVTQFTSHAQYRAWGALKSRVHGNGTNLNVVYNSRQLLTSYSAGPAIGATYEYYSDGQPKFVNAQTYDADGSKDRAYSYDIAGRLVDAYSGSEAREFVNSSNGNTTLGPYRRSYTYDEWNNLVQDDGRYWGRNTLAVAEFDATNRNPFWSYDPEGNLITRNEQIPNGAVGGTPLTKGFDAAGREISSKQSRAYYIASEGGTLTFSYTNTQTFDGDGQLMHYAHTRTTTFNGIPTGSNTESGYWLRSTVLGGLAVSEYDATGWKRTFVYSNTERIGEQTQVANDAFNMWRIKDPITGDGVDTTTTGAVFGLTTLDPQGVNLGDVDPFPTDGSGDPDGFIPDGVSSIDKESTTPLPIEGGGAMCTIDGLVLDCLFAGENNTQQCPNGACGTRWNPHVRNGRGSFGAFETFYAFANGFSGWMTDYGYRHYEGGSHFYQSAYDDFHEQKSQLQRGDESRASVSQNPGRLSEREHDILLEDLEALLRSRKDCMDFVRALLTTVAINTRKPGRTDPVDVFKEIRKQGGVVLDPTLRHPGEAWGALSGSPQNPATIKLSSISFAPGSFSWFRGTLVLSEVLHFAAVEGVYLDSDLAWAGYQVAWSQGYNVGPPPSGNDSEEHSKYFHNTLEFAACHPYQRKN